MIVKGYAAHFGRANKNLERVTPEAFDEIIRDFNNGHLNIPININHSEKIIGKVIKMKKDSVGLFIEAEIFDNIPEALEIQGLIENDLFNFFSTEGYIREKDCKENRDGTYTVSRFRLTAIAVVNQPADVKAELSVASVENDFEKFIYLEEDNKEYEKLSIYNFL